MSAIVRKITRRQKKDITGIITQKGKRVRLILLSVGVIFIFFSFGLRNYTNNLKSDPNVSGIESFQNEPVRIDEALTKPLKDQKKDPPVRILVPELNIDLSVKEAKVVNGYWEVFPSGAGWGSGSAYPGDQGNQVVFAHARAGMFLPLKKAKVGESVYIFTRDRWFTYRVTEINEVTPDNTSVIAPTNDEVLTLYTCTGFDDAKRIIVKAKRV